MSNKISELLVSAGIIGLTALTLHYHKAAATEKDRADQLQRENTLQAATIEKQAITAQAFNTQAAAAQQHATKTEKDSEEKTIEYRTILKKENVPVCSQFVPANVSDRLYSYTDRLRSGAVSGPVSNVNSTGAGTASARTLTYCQAVLWIDPLLSAIDKANDQLSGIRAEDAQRTGVKSPRQSPAS